MKTLRFALAPLAATALAFAISPVRTRVAVASSHAEAPAIADDPAMDNTDVWAWQDSASTITIVTAWNGVSTPSGGPNYKKWVPYPQAIYEIHIDTDGDGVEDVTYQFRFSNVDANNAGSGPAPTFLRVGSPINGYAGPNLPLNPTDGSQKFCQTYTVSKILGQRRSNQTPKTSASFPVCPPNTGPQFTIGRAGGFNASITGTVAITNNSTTVTGTNTLFQTTPSLAVGQQIQFGCQAGTIYTIAGITADTALTISPAFTGAGNTATTILTQGTSGNGITPAVAGTVALTNGNTAVTGTGTTFTTSLFTGETIVFASQAGTAYTIASITDDTDLVLNGAGFSGATTGSTTVLTGYEANFAQPAIQTINSTGFNGEVTFVGPRADAFFVDLGPTFDRLKIRTVGSTPPVGAATYKPAATLVAIPDVGQYGGAFNTLAGKNVECIAIQIPISQITPAGSLATFLGNPHVGVWASSSRSKVRVLPTNKNSGQAHSSQPVDTRDVSTGSFVQVSRLGNPLVNELFIPFDKKDAWNGDVPSNDTAHWGQYFSNPEVAGIINAVYGVTVPPAPRNDLQFLFAPDTLKVTAINGAGSTPLTASSHAFVFGPNTALDGRTLADDAVDIYLKAAAGVLVEDPSVGGPFGFASLFGMPSFFPPTLPGAASPTTLNVLLGDGCDYGTDGSACGIHVMPTTFPYMPTPWDGQEVGNDYFQSPRHP